MAFTMMTLDMCGGMKMILIDYNQISISNLMAELNKRPTDNIDFDLVRHMILNTIRGYRKKWHDEFGEVVIACDNRRYWRRQVFQTTRQVARRREKIVVMIGTPSLSVLSKSNQNLMNSCPIPSSMWMVQRQMM